MNRPQEKLASALQVLKDLQDRGLKAISGTELARSHREVLARAGFLNEVIRGWYIPKRPDEDEGDTTAWYASLREFVAGYATKRFGESWHVNPEQSLLFLSGQSTVPKQISIWATAGTNQSVKLLHDSSLFIYQAPALLPSSREENCGGLRLVELPSALVLASPTVFVQSAMAARIALASLADASEVLRVLLAGSHSVAAGRLAGALRAVGRPQLADEIFGAMRAAGNLVNELNPFEKPPTVLLPGGRAESPYVQRLRLMWMEMKDSVIEAFPPPAGAPADIGALLRDVEARYVTDAYHSLSIEGYRVSATLIEKVREGDWSPHTNDQDRAMRDAMAARGYFETHTIVKEDLVRVIGGENAGIVVGQELSRWYQALFGPSVKAGILGPADLAGYRNDQVYIRGAHHVPMPKDAVRECMPVFFELLEAETAPQVRAVLGHFLFVYIHPYMDGNGRLGRFLMNLMLAAAGYVWTVIPVEQRDEYMDALEQASSFDNITPFAAFVAGLARAQSKAPLPAPR